MDGRGGKVVCHLRKGGDLKKEMKQEYCAGSVEEIHSVATINNVETSYFTQLKYVIPNDNVSKSVGNLDHVLIVYSSMEHMT